MRPRVFRGAPDGPRVSWRQLHHNRTRATVPAMLLRGFHINFGNHGFWLPNDPIGSNSNYVRAPHLVPFGKATKVENGDNPLKEKKPVQSRLFVTSYDGR